MEHNVITTLDYSVVGKLTTGLIFFLAPALFCVRIEPKNFFGSRVIVYYAHATVLKVPNPWETPLPSFNLPFSPSTFFLTGIEGVSYFVTCEHYKTACLHCQDISRQKMTKTNLLTNCRCAVIIVSKFTTKKDKL